jgi:hypothetical protein
VRKPLLIAAIGLTAVLGIGGCSSSTSSDRASSATTAEGTITAAYLTAANTICAAVDTQINALDPSGSNDTTPEQMATFFTTAADDLSGALTKLKALPEPTALSSQLQAVYAQNDQLVTELQKGATAAGQNQLEEVAAISTQFQADQTAANEAWDAIGASECGTPTGSTSTTAG